MIRFITAVLLFMGLAAAAVAEESSPLREPQLRIEAGAHVAVIRRVGASADGKVIVTAAEDKTARVWSAVDGSLQRILRVPAGHGDDGKLFAVAISPDGSTIAAGGWDHTDGGSLYYHVYIFDRLTGRILQRLGPNPNAINDLAFSADGKYLAAGFGVGGLRVWQTRNWELLGGDEDYGGSILTIAFSPKGGFAAGSRDGSIRYYDENFQLVKTMPAPSGDAPDSIAFAPDGKRLAVGYSGVVAVDLLSIPDLKKVAAADVRGIDIGDLGAVAWSADGQTLYAGGQYNTKEERMPVFFWPKAGKGKRKQFDATGDTIMDMVGLANDGVAIAGADHSLVVLNADGTLRFRNGPVSADMRGKLGDAFLISDDAMRVRFGLEPEGRMPWIFDVSQLSLTASPQAPEGLHVAKLDGLALTDWNSNESPQLNGKSLQLDHSEKSRSAAIAPSANWLVLGADWSLRRYGSDGGQQWSRPVPEVTWGVNIDTSGELVVAAHLDGTIRWYRAEDGAELLALYVQAQDKRWIAWTPKGYFAASPGGESLMGWLVNRGWTEAPDFYPASQFHDRFYRPDIVASILTAGDEEKAIQAANAAANRKADDRDVADVLPPSIEIIDPAPLSQFSQPSVTLKYVIHTADGSPADAVDILIDGRPPATRGASEAPAESGEGEIEVSLPPRDVEVSLIARNGDGASVPATIALRYAGTAAASAKGKLYAVLVGVSDYDDPSMKLQFADDDATAFGAALQGLAGKTYAAVETKVLTDKAGTEENIRDALSWLEERTTADDTGILFLAGHGMTDPKERFYYLPVGGEMKPERLRATAIPDAEIQDAIAQVAGKVIFFIDACHSAAGLEGARSAADVTGVINRLARADTGVIMFASSTGREVSYESSAWGHGAFTAAILEGLSGKADYQKDGRITVAELNLWLSSRVAELTEQRQNAVMVKPDTIKDFALADVQP